jgi:hypothetical protein
MLELSDLIFDSEFLSLEVCDSVGIGKRSGDFEAQRLLQIAMLGAEFFDTVLRRHGTSLGQR